MIVDSTCGKQIVIHIHLERDLIHLERDLIHFA